MARGSIGTGTAVGEGVFLRKASGLIKTAGTWDVFIYNIGLVSVGIGLGTMVLFGPAVYFGSNLYIGVIFASIVMSFVALGMLTWTLVIPRSGGVYPFASRILPPSLAFTLSFVESIAWLFACANAAFWIVSIGLVPMLSVAGIITGSSALDSAATTLGQPWPTFIVGSAILLLAGYIVLRGMKTFFFTQKIAFAIAMAGSVFLIVLLLFTSNSQFVGNFNSLFGPNVTYQGVIDAAIKGGWSSTFSWNQTLLGSVWAFYPLIGAAFSIAIGGEIKSVGRAQTIGMMGAVWVSALLWILTFAVALPAFGYNFLGAVGFNSLNALPSTPTTPYLTLLAGIATKSWLVTFVVSLGFIAWIWLWIPGMQAYAQRAMVAWSFDRLAPARLADISERSHTPVVAVLVAVAVTIVFMAGFVFTPWFATNMIVFIEAAFFAWSFVLLAGVFFPYRRKEMYEKSPIANMKILGLPVMSVACGLGFLGGQVAGWLLFSDNFAAGHQPIPVTIVAAAFVLGLVLYFIAKQVRRRQGINIDLAFKQIPIE